VLSLIGLTGSILVFYGPLLRIEAGYKLFDVKGPPPIHAAVDSWIAGTLRSYPDVGAINAVIGAGFGLGGGNVANLGVQEPNGRSLTITVDPNSGQPLGKFYWDDTYMSGILMFHARLTRYLSWGGEALAWLGVAMLVSMATGLYLWWPRNRNWRLALTLKRGARGRRRLLDLHNLFAVYLYVPLFILAFTGVYFIKPNWIDPAVGFLSAPRTADADALARTAKPGTCNARTSPGQAVDLAQARFPSSKFVLMNLPKEPQQPYRIQLAPPNNIDVKGQTAVFVDRECPFILTAIDGATRLAKETFQSAMFPLHANMMLGAFGSIIVFLAGLLLPVSFVTGVLLWLDKRRNRSRTAST
jgi:uncharacterized iron-regulated membrane protein